jgi:hypothetical protein
MNCERGERRIGMVAHHRYNVHIVPEGSQRGRGVRLCWSRTDGPARVPKSGVGAEGPLYIRKRGIAAVRLLILLLSRTTAW